MKGEIETNRSRDERPAQNAAEQPAERHASSLILEHLNLKGQAKVAGVSKQTRERA